MDIEEAPAPKHAGGRPPKYNPEICELVTKFCMLGCTDERLAELLGIATSTLYYWKNVHPEFLEAVKNGKELADVKVVESLYKEATSGNVTAGIFWLCNRQKDSWRQRQEHTGVNGGAIEHKHDIAFVIVDPAAS
jgi:hypothetical protein